MKSKIYKEFMIIAVLAIILTTAMTTAIYYQVFQKEVFDDLENICTVMEQTGVFEQEDLKVEGTYGGESTNLRITLIASDGRVLYDTNASVNSLDNHKDRPEIAQAFSEGKGKSIRTSTTINKSNYYYAVLLDNGSVLRAAKETRSIINLFCSVLPVILLIGLFLLILSMLISHYLTKSLVKPIEQVASNLDHLEQIRTYKELMPFIQLIREQHENILKAANMRQEFTANVSHELKTPLTSISGYSELIENGMVSQNDVGRFAGEIHRNARRLISLINDILKLSELDSSREDTLNLEDVDLYELAENSIVMLGPVAEKRHIRLHLEGESCVVRADRDLMEEVIYNLCDNAIRYNRDDGNVWVHIGQGFSVRDDGIGISQEHQQRIFERFYRVDKSRSKKTGGTGLGLAIVKHIVDLHGGEIRVESAPGLGTTVSVSF